MKMISKFLDCFYRAAVLAKAELSCFICLYIEHHELALTKSLSSNTKRNISHGLCMMVSSIVCSKYCCQKQSVQNQSTHLSANLGSTFIPKTD